MSLLISLDCLPTGDLATVARLEGSPECTKRLEEMGLRPGKTVEVLRSGSPCIVRVGSIRLCMRRDRRMCVLVRHTNQIRATRAQPVADVGEHLLDGAPQSVRQPTLA